MDLELEEVESLSAVASIVHESVSVTAAAPQTFSLITLVLVLPLSFATLALSLFTHPIIAHLQSSTSTSSSADAAEFSRLLLYQFIYLLVLLTFSLLSTSAVVFTVASVYTSKPVTFSTTLAAIRPIYLRLLCTFLWVAPLMVLYYLAFGFSIIVILALFLPAPFLFLFLVVLLLLDLLGFLLVHVYLNALWHLASVVSVLEPICGLAAMEKSRALLSGRTRMAMAFVSAYLVACGIVGTLFRGIVVMGPGEEGSFGVQSGGKRVVAGGALVAAQVAVNLVGLLTQSVFYYVCKSYHNEQIDRSALHDHLGGYLGEYVPLQSSIQMENLSLTP